MHKRLFYIVILALLVSIISVLFPTSSGSVAAPAVKIGNIPVNLSNGGYFAKKGDWLYYSNGFYEGKLYKSKMDGNM